MPIHYKKIGEMLVLSGQTFPYKEAIKALGGRFNYDEKNWAVLDSETTRLAVDRLVRSTGGICLDQEAASSKAQMPPPPSAPSIDTIEAALEKAVQFNNVTDTSNLESESPPAYTVSTLLMRLERAVRSQFPDSIWIVGELQNVSIKEQAVYFRLAESQNQKSMASAEISGSIWSTALQRLKRKIAEDIAAWFAEGLEVKLYCQVNFYRERAQISLQVLDIDSEFSLGKLALQRQATVKSLKQRGLFNKNRQVPMPRFPLRIGLITAAGSRAKSDFLNQLELSGYGGTIVFFAASMQGKNTSKEVIAGIQALQNMKVDVIVMTRGGGSQSDLRWFDAEDIALAICHAKVPFLTAIGHHDDVSVAEEVSHLAVKTPTAAAEAIASIMQQRRLDLQNLLRALQANLENQIVRKGTGLLQLENNLKVACTQYLQRKQQLTQSYGQKLLQTSTEAIFKVRRRLDGQLQILHNQALSTIQRHEQASYTLLAKIQGADPRPWMQKGWTQLELQGKTIKSKAELNPGDQVKARLPDGLVYLNVLDSSEGQTS